MMEEPNIKIEEKRVVVAERKPPGDRWVPLSNNTVTLESLTDCLEFVYQKMGDTKFYIDAREGLVYTVYTEEKVVEPEPEKRYSLYGEY